MLLGHLRVLRFLVQFFFAFSFLQMVYAETSILKEGEVTTITGTLLITEDLDSHDKMVAFEAIQLDTPLVVVTEDGEREVMLMKLWLSPEMARQFKVLLGKRVRAKGKVLYYWHGPSTYPTPAKLEVIDFKSASED